MKISKSKQELASIISENGGWRDGAEWAIQHGTGRIAFTKSTKKPLWEKDNSGWGGSFFFGGFSFRKLQQHHQNALSSTEYFHLYPAPDADGWIEWNGGECPVGGDCEIGIRVRGEGGSARGKARRWSWGHSGCGSDIIAYRLHKPEQAETEFCESVMRSIPEPEAKPTIERLAADYRNAKDFAERKQKEADDARDDADARLKALELAGEGIGLIVSPITAKQEPELVITDWRDLRVGDEVEYVTGLVEEREGLTGRVVETMDDGDGLNVRLELSNGEIGCPSSWRFILRP